MTTHPELIQTTPVERRLSRRLGFVSHSVIAFAALSFAAFPATKSRAQDAPVQLPPVNVEAEQPGDYKVDSVSSPKITTPLRETPQTINVVPRELIEDRSATTLREVLRNVPGISMQAGEGGVPEGDNFTIRGFNGRTDTFLDGARDFGVYFRDPFNYQQIEVSKGPSGTYAGRGSTGGAVNQVSKTPLADAFGNGTVMFGTDMTKRATMDINQPLTGLAEDSAFRLNLLAHDSEVADRDVVEKSRWGFAPSLAFGLTGPTKITLSYFHLSQDEIPDRGVPFINGRPAPVDRSNFYGIKNRDYYEATVDIVSAEVKHRFNENVSLRNLTRYGYNTVDYVVSNPSGADLAAGTINPTTRARDSIETMLINQTDLTTKFETGPVGHTLVSGIELSYETTENRARSNVAGPTTSLFDPDPDRVGATAPYTGARTEGDGTGVALYAIDTIALGSQWDLILGGRWDYFDVDTTSVATPGVATDFARTDREFSWRTGLVYKPVPYGSIYAAYGTSYNPSSERLTLNANTEVVAPEKTNTYEVGTKWDILGERLSLTGAIFRIEKTNARTNDPLGGTVQVLDGEQRVDGFEIGFAGTVMPNWKVYGGYTYLAGEVTKSNDPAQVGAEPINTPPHSFSFWTTYDTPWKLRVGAGAQYVDRRIGGNSESGFAATSTNVAPDYLIFDAMVSYPLTEKVGLQLNVLNITDETYYDASYSGFTVPGAGRTVLLTTDVKF